MSGDVNEVVMSDQVGIRRPSVIVHPFADLIRIGPCNAAVHGVCVHIQSPFATPLATLEFGQ